MSVQSTARYAGPFAGNGVTTVFAFGFKVFAASDIIVTTTVIIGGAVSNPVNGVDYTVALNADQNVNPGGNVTFAVAPPATVSFYVTSGIPKAQGSQFPNPGPWNPTTGESAWDKSMAIIQELGQAALLFAPGDVASTHVLPSPAARALKFPFFDAAGAPTVVAAVSTAAFIGAVQTGQLVFGSAGGLLNQDSNLFWDNTNKRLGIGNAAPTKALDVSGTIKASSDVNSAAIVTAVGAVTNWNSRNAADNAYSSAIYDASQHIFKVAGAEAFRFDVSKNLIAGTDNAFDIGASGATRPRTGYFGTSVVTPLVQSPAATPLTFQAGSSFGWGLQTDGVFYPQSGDATADIGKSTNRIQKVYTTIIDSGTTGSLSLKTNNGTTQFTVDHAASAVNFLHVVGGAAASDPILYARGSDTNVNLHYDTQAAGSHTFSTNSTAQIQFQVLHTASASRNITVTGNNGGNPTLGVTAGALDIAAAVNITAGNKISIHNGADTTATLGQVSLGYTGTIQWRNQANSGDLIGIGYATQNSVTDILQLGLIGGNGVMLKARSGGAAPTTSDLSSGQWAVWRDTGGATTKLYYNNAGTIQSVALA